ncbi:uncharacterized protein LOC122512690 isoform X2 [Leptopilina heterotoma]|uniref:uncharacterized protein LOC122512690 isoform X2 n=1 Tax=Leptopilina heterotoma TaxID=63436 RepID=UPI001CA8D3B4|nr:uncharacterized protein LOC122512690 isoform X2 [Leptopilina heterotoma]
MKNIQLFFILFGILCTFFFIYSDARPKSSEDSMLSKRILSRVKKQAELSTGAPKPTSDPSTIKPTTTTTTTTTINPCCCEICTECDCKCDCDDSSSSSEECCCC